MQPPCLGACSGSLALLAPRGCRHRLFYFPGSASRASVSCAAGGGKASPRGKENVWSVDNDRRRRGGVQAPEASPPQEPGRAPHAAVAAGEHGSWRWRLCSRPRNLS